MDWDPRESMPLTVSVFGTPEDREGPPPINKEWSEAVRGQDQSSMLAWVGEWNRCGRHLGWCWTFWNLGDPLPDSPRSPVGTPAEKIERMLAPIAQAGRIGLMQAMYDGPKSPTELTESTGLKGGNLYYHLRELIYAAYVKDLDGRYDLTELGCQILFTMSCIAGLAVQDKGEEGLLVAPGH